MIQAVVPQLVTLRRETYETPNYTGAGAVARTAVWSQEISVTRGLQAEDGR